MSDADRPTYPVDRQRYVNKGARIPVWLDQEVRRAVLWLQHRVPEANYTHAQFWQDAAENHVALLKQRYNRGQEFYQYKKKPPPMKTMRTKGI